MKTRGVCRWDLNGSSRRALGLLMGLVVFLGRARFIGRRALLFGVPLVLLGFGPFLYINLGKKKSIQFFSLFVYKKMIAVRKKKRKSIGK